MEKEKRVEYEQQLDKLLDELCGCADHISLADGDEDTATDIDRISNEIHALFKKVFNEEEVIDNEK